MKTSKTIYKGKVLKGWYTIEHNDNIFEVSKSSDGLWYIQEYSWHTGEDTLKECKELIRDMEL